MLTPYGWLMHQRIPRPATRRAASESVTENFPKHNRLIVLLIVRRVDERKRTLARHRPQLLHELRSLPELCTVAAAELVPALRIVSEPPAQFATGSHFLQ